MNPIRKILNKYKALGLFDSNEELAGILDCSARKIGYVLSGDAHLSDEELLVLQRYFGQMGRFELNYLGLAEGYAITVRGESRIDGCTLDEFRDIVQTLSRSEENKHGDLDLSIKEANDLRGLVDQYIAELKAMRA